jgi:hypothetical protein
MDEVPSDARLRAAVLLLERAPPITQSVAHQTSPLPAASELAGKPKRVKRR